MQTQQWCVEPISVLDAVEMAKEARLPEIASSCELCPFEWLCPKALENQFQVAACEVHLLGEYAQILRTHLAKRIVQFHQSA